MTSSSPLGFFPRLWLRWRSLNLPWRRKRLAGMDLTGTTFWELKDPLNPVRARRVAQHSRRAHYADVQVSPAWHQWLRHTRVDPPTMEEQKADIQRQVQLKQLAQLADERWASKASYLDAPKNTAQPAPATAPRDPGGYIGETEPEERQGVRGGVKSQSSFNQRKGAPGEKWQPESWNPGIPKR